MPELHEDVLAHRHWLLSLVELPERGTVVELGCGRGEDLLALAARAPDAELEFVGVDASEQSVAAARARAAADPRLRVDAGRLNGRLPFADGSVDVVYSNNLLECLAEPARLAREVARVLRPAGQVVVGHWDWDSQSYDGDDRAQVRRLVHAFADWQQAWMERSDGWMGRRLWGVFHASGAFSGEVHARVLLNTRFAAPWFGFVNAQALRGLARRGLAQSKDVEGFLREQAELHRQGRYIYGITGYAYVGRRAPRVGD